MDGQAKPPMRSPVTTYEVDARSEGSGVSTVRSKAAPALRFESSAGQTEDLLGPSELLAAAFAACLLKNVERFSKILELKTKGAAIHVVLERRESPPRIAAIRYNLTIDTTEPESRVDLLRRNLLKFGTIYNTLSLACEIRGEIVADAR